MTLIPDNSIRFAGIADEEGILLSTSLKKKA